MFRFNILAKIYWNIEIRRYISFKFDIDFSRAVVESFLTKSHDFSQYLSLWETSTVWVLLCMKYVMKSEKSVFKLIARLRVSVEIFLILSFRKILSSAERNSYVWITKFVFVENHLEAEVASSKLSVPCQSTRISFIIAIAMVHGLYMTDIPLYVKFYFLV